MSMNGLCMNPNPNMSDRERNVRVSFKLSKEAAIKLREIALTKSELLCNLGVLAVQLGNESQICISSALTFENGARTANNNTGKAPKRHVEKAKESLKDASKVTKFDNSAKRLLHVDRGVRPVDQALARATADSVMISDSLPSMNTLNKASFINKTSSQGNSRAAHEIHANSIQESCNITRNLCASYVENNTVENQSAMKPILYNGVIKFNAKDAVSQDVESHRNALFEKQPSKNDAKNALYAKPARKNSRDDTTACTGNEIQDDANVHSVNIDSISTDTLKYAKDMSACQDSNPLVKTIKQDEETVPKAITSTQDLPKVSTSTIDSDGQKYDKTDIKMDSNSLSEHDNMSNMTDSFDCSVNNSDIPTFPGHGISFAQHLINLSKQYRLENEKSPTGLANEKFFEASRFVRNDHVLRCFTAGNEKHEDFMGFTGQNALLFDGSYSATAVKSAEELSKEQSEASPTNLDSMSETSADSLFEDARLGSVDELSLSPSSNENVPISSEDNSRGTSPTPIENKPLDNQYLQVKQEKHKRKIKYQRHLKGHSGIICKLCMHPVSKSYSCYKLAHAPKEIRHLFDDGSHCVRVCRRCLPYKSPKSSEKNTQKRLHKTIENLLK